MSIFKNHKTTADRSATDRSRHKKKIERAIREGVHNIVSDESIIGKDGKKKIKIPVRGIKEFKFVYGKNESNRRVGSAPGKPLKKGQKLLKKKPKDKGQGEGKAGKDPGEEFYEVEITLEELSSYLFDSLKLPDLEKKKFKNIVSNKFKRSGYKSQGIRPRLSKKETLKNKIKRKKAAQRTRGLDEEERFPFHKKDLKYKRIKQKKDETTNAVIFCIMDVSGSMTQNKRFIARSFYFLLYHFLRHKYKNLEIVFISHTVDAKEVSEDDFFTVTTMGGTIISSGLEKCLEIVKERYHPSMWNVYAFHCSDGDNWPEDDSKAISRSLELKDLCQLYCYIQIIPLQDLTMWSKGGMAEKYYPLTDEKFKVVQIENKDQIWQEFNRLFGGGET
tara:strand:- start:173 stop:1339 length:1167 start_codon:yes stop_codon:yes gene_type:complete